MDRSTTDVRHNIKLSAHRIFSQQEIYGIKDEL